MDLNEFIPLLHKLKVQNVLPLIVISKIILGMYNLAAFVVLYFLLFSLPAIMGDKKKNVERDADFFLHRGQ